LVVLSPQQILDCSRVDFKNQGCDGGYADEAFSYVIANGIGKKIILKIKNIQTNIKYFF
jgi:hypothetical protein